MSRSISLYANYIQEREDFLAIEDEYGFATFKIENEDCYVRDVFVVPELRRCGHGTKYLDRIKRMAQGVGAKTLSTSVCPGAVGSTESLKAVLSYGFRLFLAKENFIIFRMDI